MQTVAEEMSRRVQEVFERAAGRWVSCDWPTTFGTRRLNLEVLTASQELLLARATAGAEAADWRAAVTWLTQIEKDAARVEALARRALSLSQQGRLREVLDFARQACLIESNYHPTPAWQPFCDVIEALLKEHLLEKSKQK